MKDIEKVKCPDCGFPVLNEITKYDKKGWLCPRCQARHSLVDLLRDP